MAPQDVPSSTFREIKEYCGRNGKFSGSSWEENEGPKSGTTCWMWEDESHPSTRGSTPRGCSTGTGRPAEGQQNTWCASATWMRSPETGKPEGVRPRLRRQRGKRRRRRGGTAPTCGASGVLPAVLLFKQEQQGFSDTDVLHALAAAGIVGKHHQTNASISGAECGCQAEVGSALLHLRRRAWRSCPWTWTRSSTRQGWPWSTTWA